MSNRGLFELRTPVDLLGKAERDLVRLRSNPLDVDAAFDFFVTARHVPDWVEAYGGRKAGEVFKQHVELRVCRHIADGAKHFLATHTNHRQVSGTSTAPGGFQSNAFQASAYQVGALTIVLDPTDPDVSALGPSIDAVRLAERVVKVLKGVVP